jgi:hypothetical protein
MYIKTCLQQHVQKFVNAESIKQHNLTLRAQIAQAEAQVYEAAASLISQPMLAQLVG